MELTAPIALEPERRISGDTYQGRGVFIARCRGRGKNLTHRPLVEVTITGYPAL
jgi:hypothetical protein